MSDLRERLQSALGAGYRIERDLGGGGMSRVFVAEDIAVGREVVVKVLPPELAAGVSVERFRREIHLAARLQHPHIVPLLTTGAADGLLWYTMPFIRGESLRSRLAQHGAMTIDDTIAVLRDVVDGLSYAHSEGVVHRDVKPENILLQSDHALVVDFGVAKALSAATDEAALTSSGVTLGTPAYMAPEQIAAEANVDHRADIYAIGVVGYEMLTGRSPFAGPSQQAIIAAHMTKTPERVVAQRATVPAALDELIMRSLEKNPADRWQSAREMRARLDAMRSASAPTVTATDGLSVSPRVVTDPSAKPGAEPKAEPSEQRTPYSLRYVAAAGIVVALVAGAIFYSKTRGSSDTEEAAVLNRLSDSASSVAVLPFVNMSGSKDNEYFSDGMTEELISALAKIQGLRVVARTSSFAFKGKGQDIRRIAQQLGATNVVEGSVRRAGGRFRVTAQLINARNGYHLWSDTFDGDVTDVFAVQDSISHSIAGALAGRLVAQSAPASDRARSRNARAYDFYLRGRFFFNQAFKRADLETSLAMFDSALAIDPKFALAYSGIADTYSYLADDFLPPREAYPKAKVAAERAIALDSTLSEAHAALAAVHVRYTWNWPAAKRELELALVHNPNYAQAHSLLGQYFAIVRDTARAVAELQTAVGLDPVSTLVLFDAARNVSYVGRTDLAQRVRQRAVEIDSTMAGRYRTNMAIILLSAGDTARAIALMDSVEVQYPKCCTELKGNFYALAGRSEKARGYLRGLEARRRTSYVRGEMIARVYSSLGDADNAFKWLEIAYAERSAGLPWVLRDREFERFRRDPRYLSLLDRTGFLPSGALKHPQ